MVTVGKKKKHLKTSKGRTKETEKKFSKAVQVTNETQKDLVFDYDNKVITWNFKVKEYKEKLEKSDVALLKYKNINDLKEERFRNSRDEMNVEIISKEIFLKELEIIVNTYEDIYNDNEIQKMFETFKENF